jgi:hypothetical protein
MPAGLDLQSAFREKPNSEIQSNGAFLKQVQDRLQRMLNRVPKADLIKNHPVGA